MNIGTWARNTVLGLITLWLLLVIGAARAETFTENVYKFGSFHLEIYGVVADTVRVGGVATLEWSDAGSDTLHAGFTSENLTGNTQQDGHSILVTLSTATPSTGWSDDRVFPAGSSFDYYVEVTAPDLLPGVTMSNQEPLHISAQIDQFPPWFSRYENPPSQIVPLLDESLTPVGEIAFWNEECVPYSDPKAWVFVPTGFNNRIAVPAVNGLLTVTVEHSGFFDAHEATLSFRLLDSGSPFTLIGIDHDGTAPGASTTGPLGGGDGWTSYLDISGFPLEGGWYEIEGCLASLSEGTLCALDTVYIDPTPPTPQILSIPPDSVGYFHEGIEAEITFQVPDELINKGGDASLVVYSAEPVKSRDLTSINQIGLGTNVDNMACGPTAAACCLEYWADNGYGDLDNPKGDASKPEQTPAETAKELVSATGTTAKGTGIQGMGAGIKSYLEAHGESIDDEAENGWSVKAIEVENSAFFGYVDRAFETDEEDVILLLYYVNAAGDTCGHYVTLGGVERNCYEVFVDDASCFCVSYKISFMDPGGGVLPSAAEYEMGINNEGMATVTGYPPTGAVGDAWIHAAIKVSPPGSSEMFPEEWTPFDTITARGGAVLDTLRLNTGGFGGGMYLVAVTVTNDLGEECSDMRLCGIPSYIAGVDEGGDEQGLPERRPNEIHVHPNPFNPRTTIGFSLDRDAPVSLAIYDLAGRRVRDLLVSVEMSAGRHEVAWDGCSDGGRALASGNYICRMLVDGNILSVKMNLVR